MAFTPADPVASGKPYPVTGVAGREPADLADFVGQTSFTIGDGAADRVICGVGSSVGDAVRFQEKDGSGVGKDVRAWQLSRGADGGFVAVHAAAH